MKKQRLLIHEKDPQSGKNVKNLYRIEEIYCVSCKCVKGFKYGIMYWTSISHNFPGFLKWSFEVTTE